MIGKPNSDRASRRRAATRAEILEAAWQFAREHGLAGFSLRDLAGAVGMRAPSLYEYFDSKTAIYDAMFAEAYSEFAVWTRDLPFAPDDPAATLAAAGRRFIAFCAEDPARYQLMFQRSIPGFAPTPEAYAASLEAMAETRRSLAALGIADDDDVDLWIAVVSGLAAQQLANEPAGDHWVRLVDDAAHMFLSHHAARSRS